MDFAIERKRPSCGRSRVLIRSLSRKLVRFALRGGASVNIRQSLTEQSARVQSAQSERIVVRQIPRILRIALLRERGIHGQPTPARTRLTVLLSLSLSTRARSFSIACPICRHPFASGLNSQSSEPGVLDGIPGGPGLGTDVYESVPVVRVWSPPSSLKTDAVIFARDAK